MAFAKFGLYRIHLQFCRVGNGGAQFEVVAHDDRRSVHGGVIRLPLIRHSAQAVIVIVLVWGIAFGAIPFCLRVWMQLTSPDLPEAGSTLFVGTIQVATAAGSLIGGAVVDKMGVHADLWFGGSRALLGLAVVHSGLTMHAISACVSV